MPWSPAPSSSLALLLLGVDAHGDVGRLAVQQHLDVGAVTGEAVLVVADVLDHAARDLGDQLAVRPPTCAVTCLNSGAWPRPSPAMTILLVVAERLAAEPRVDLAVVGDAELDVVLEERVEDRVGNLVADLVRMAFGHGLAGEQIIGVRHLSTLPQRAGLRAAPDNRAPRFCSVLEAVKMWAVVGKRGGGDAGASRAVSPCLRPRSARPDRRSGGAAWRS